MRTYVSRNTWVPGTGPGDPVRAKGNLNFRLRRDSTFFSPAGRLNKLSPAARLKMSADPVGPQEDDEVDKGQDREEARMNHNMGKLCDSLNRNPW